MLKKRIVACLVVKDGIVVQSIGFKKYLPIGNPKIAVEFLNYWGIDEIILVDISAGPNKTGPNYAMIQELSNKCHVPLTVGGGIESIEQIKKLMDCGADKISLNFEAITNPELIRTAAKVYGNQCIVVSIDAKKDGTGYKVFCPRTRKALDMQAIEWCIKAESLGAGEIFITAVDKDGSFSGFDLPLMKEVSETMKIPVIASGGAGNGQHFVDLFQHSSVSAASAANFFHFTEHAVITTKSVIHKSLPIRLDTVANYNESVIDRENRLIKREDEYLEDLLYIRIDKEII